MSSEAQETRQIDPEAPFIASDGLEYGDFADFICQTPLACPRNEHILAHRKAGRSEEAIRLWIKAYDGEDPIPSSQIDAASAAIQRGRALHRAHVAWNSLARTRPLIFTPDILPGLPGY